MSKVHGLRMKFAVLAAGVSIWVGSVANAQQFGVMPDARHMFIIRQDGLLITWGKGMYGNLGIGNTTDQDTAIYTLKGQYSGTTYFGDASGNGVLDVAGDPFHSLAVTLDGLVYTWGDNTGGQLGDGSYSQRTTPVKVRAGQYGGTYLGENSTNKIIMVRGGSSSSSGHSYSAALSQSGLVYTWGYGSRGQIGDNALSTRSIPVKVRAGQYGIGRTYLGDMSTNKIVAISSGEEGFTLALSQEGMLYSWGFGGNGTCGNGGRDGRLGDGSTVNRSVPIRVRKGQYPGTTYLGDVSTNRVIAISTGGSISTAMTQDGTVYAWGLGCSGTQGVGKLGNNTMASASTPVRVWAGQYGGTYLGESSTNTIRQFVAGGRTIAALTSTNQLYVWAENVEGQIGSGSTGTRSTPVRTVMGLYPGTTYFGDNSTDTITSIAMSERNGFALAQSGKIYSWGQDLNSELGDCAIHSPTYVSTPVNVKGNFAGNPCEDLVMPITLTSFEVSLRGNDVLLDWHTVSEVNSYAMELERRSETHENWERICVKPGHGTTNQPHDYQYRDDISQFLHQLPIKLLYRLKSVDLDGSFRHSGVLEINLTSMPTELVVHQVVPNPFSDFTTVTFSVPSESNVSLRLYDVNGKLMRTYVDEELEPGNYKQTIATNEEWISGIYYLKLTANGTSVSRAVQIVQ